MLLPQFISGHVRIVSVHIPRCPRAIPYGPKSTHHMENVGPMEYQCECGDTCDQTPTQLDRPVRRHNHWERLTRHSQNHCVFMLQVAMSISVSRAWG